MLASVSLEVVEFSRRSCSPTSRFRESSSSVLQAVVTGGASLHLERGGVSERAHDRARAACIPLEVRGDQSETSLSFSLFSPCRSRFPLRRRRSRRKPHAGLSARQPLHSQQPWRGSRDTAHAGGRTRHTTRSTSTSVRVRAPAGGPNFTATTWAREPHHENCDVDVITLMPVSHSLRIRFVPLALSATPPKPRASNSHGE